MLKGIRWMTQIVFTNECMHRIKPAGSFGSRMFNFVLQILIQDQGNLFIICFLDVMWISSSKLCCVRKFSNGFLSKSSGYLTDLTNIWLSGGGLYVRTYETKVS